MGKRDEVRRIRQKLLDSFVAQVVDEMPFSEPNTPEAAEIWRAQGQAMAKRIATIYRLSNRAGDAITLL